LSEASEQAPSKQEIYRKFTSQLLMLAGYSTEQVIDLGDLISVPRQKVLDLLHQKTEEALAFAIAEKAPKFTTFKKLKGAKRKRPKR
jgi:hypothetical protein